MTSIPVRIAHITNSAAPNSAIAAGTRLMTAFFTNGLWMAADIRVLNTTACKNSLLLTTLHRDFISPSFRAMLRTRESLYRAFRL